MRLHLVDLDPDVVAALLEAFRPYPEVAVQLGDMLALAENTVVSPGNSFGFMDGGVDRAIVTFFGARIQARVLDAIALRPEGHLPVGASLVVDTGHAHVPFLIVAPTMTGPEAITPRNTYRAMRAVLRVAAQYPDVGRRVFCPGLGTGVGEVCPEEAAGEMARAYADWKAANAVGNERGSADA